MELTMLEKLRIRISLVKYIEYLTKQMDENATDIVYIADLTVERLECKQLMNKLK